MRKRMRKRKRIYYPPIVPPRGEKSILHFVQNLVKTSTATHRPSRSGRTTKAYWTHITNAALAFLRS